MPLKNARRRVLASRGRLTPVLIKNQQEEHEPKNFCENHGGGNCQSLVG